MNALEKATLFSGCTPSIHGSLAVKRWMLLMAFVHVTLDALPEIKAMDLRT
jgi:hypothetical protein